MLITLKSDIRPPTAPVLGAPSAVSSSSLSVPLSTAAVDLVAVASYSLERATSAAGTYSVVSTAATFPYVDTGLSASTTYYYRCSATDTSGNVGTYSAVVSGTTSSGSSNLTAPASGLTYENRQYVDMNFASDAAATAGGINSFDTLGSGAYAWVADPAGTAVNVWRTRYVANEDKATATIQLGSAAKYVYFQWEEYWHPSFSSASNGKANRMMSPSTGSLFLDHIYFGAPGNNYYGFVLQGSDVGWNIERNTRSPALTKGEWNTMAVEHKISTGSDGYIKLWQKIGSGSWTNMGLDYRTYPHTVGATFLTNQSGFVGQTATSASHLYQRCVVGGWVSGVTPGSNDYRYIRNVLCLYNVTNTPT